MVAVLVIWTPARAGDLESVEALIRQGVELRHQGHDVRALPLFQKAYAMARTPRAAGQLGLCEMAMGYWLDAEGHLGEALSFPEHPWVTRNLNDLTGALAAVRKNISDVVVEGGPAGAEVLVNARPVGHLPLPSPLRLGKGIADVELRSPGYVTASRSLRINGGVVERLTIVLAQAPPIAPAQAPAIIGAAPKEIASASSVAPEVPATAHDAGEPPRANPRRIAAWTTAGASALALGLGVVETFAWVGKQHQFDDHTGALPSNPAVTGRNCGAADPDYGGEGCKGLHDDLARARILTFVGYGLAAALGVTSAILFATSPDDRPPRPTAFVCAPDLVGRGMGCKINF